MQSSNHNTSRILGALAITVIAGVSGYIFLTGNSTTSKITASSPGTSVQRSAASSANSGSATSYKDGTYNATANYRVPRGSNSTTVTLSIAGGKITAVSTANSVNDSESQYYVDSFNSNISQAVVGTAIGDVSASRVGGASLTSNAFNDALQTIINDAKV